MTLTSFRVLIGHLCVFGELTVWAFCPYFDWALHFLILSYRSCLCILEINSLSVALFAINFSLYDGNLFVLFVVSFVVRKLFKFNYIPFISITLGGGSNRNLLWFMSKSVLPMFKSFIVLLTNKGVLKGISFCK